MCETWRIYSYHAKQLNSFHMVYLGKFLYIKWKDRIPDTEVLQRANMVSMHAMLRRSQMRWVGHVCHMSDECQPKRMFYSELKAGKCSHGGKKKCYKDSLKVSLESCGINSDSWEEATQIHATWHSLINTRMTAYEEDRVNNAIQKHQ